MEIHLRRHSHLKVTIALISLAALGLPEAGAVTGTPGSTAPGRGAIAVGRMATGKRLWQTSLPPGRFFSGVGTSKDLVVATDRGCGIEESAEGPRLIAFDAATGKRRWVTEGDAAAAKTSFWSPTQAIDVAARGIIVTYGSDDDSGPAGLDADSGEEQWRIPDLQLLGVTDRLVFGELPSETGLAPGLLATHDRRDGVRSWAFPTQFDESWGGTFDVAAADRDRVVVANGGYLAESNGAPVAPTTFYILDASTGAERSRFESPDPSFSFSDFVLRDDLLTFVEGTSVVARDLSSGAVAWQQPFPQSSPDGPALRSSPDAHTVFALADGQVLALDPEDGAVKWESSEFSFEASAARLTAVRPYDNDLRTLLGVTTGEGVQRWSRRVATTIAPRGNTSIRVVTGSDYFVVANECDDG